MSIQTDLNNTEASVVSIFPLISCSSRLIVFTNLLRTRSKCTRLLSLFLLLHIWLFFHTPIGEWGCDCKFPQVFRTLLSILADLINDVVWMVSSSPPISSSSSSFINRLVTVQITLMIIGISLSPSYSICLVLEQTLGTDHFFTFFQFYILVCWDGKCHESTHSLFLLTLTRYHLIVWSPFVIIIYSFRVFYTSFSRRFLTRDWVTANLLRSPGLSSVPWKILIIGIIVTFMFYSFFNLLAKSRYLSLFSFSFNFTLWSAGTAKSTIRKVLFFF